MDARSSSPFRSPSGDVDEIILRFVDVTREKTIDSAAEKTRFMLQSILDHSEAVVYIKDLKGRYIYVNKKWETSLSLTSEDAIGDTDAEMFPAELAEQFMRNDAIVFSGKNLQLEEFAPHADGVHTYFSMKLPLRDESGEIYAMAGISNDISKLKTSEKERAELLVREKSAVEASLMKSVFLANMSHELRTPINGVMGMADLMRTTPLNDEQRSFTEAIWTSADALLTLVNDILDLTKAEAGKIEIEAVGVDLRQIVNEVQTTVYVGARRKGLHLDFNVDASVSARYTGDPTRIRQVLMNLANNAIKFTTSGEVTVSLLGDTDGVFFEVLDTGVGITEESRLFKPFSQADASTTRKFGGSGLGLSISQHLVKLMGGEIGYEPRVGSGSKFWFALPLEARAVEDVPAPNFRAEPQARRALRVLIAEDNKTNQVVAAKMLQRLGHTAEVVENGLEALSALNRAKLDLVFMDCQMPEMDGYEATRSIRAGKSAAPAGIPIVALTANAMRGDREKCLEAGMTDYISKPVKAADFESAISRMIAAG